MNSALRTSLLAACVLAGLSLAAPARADDMLRSAQMHLADLGFYSGHDDGIMGRATRAAIRKFQRQNHLPVTGRLNASTYELLVSMDSTDINQPHPVVAAVDARYAAPAMAVINPGQWHYAGTQRLPVRYGALDVNEDDRGYSHRFTITMNGRPFLRADNQPGALQISQVFQLYDEDAVVMTAYRGEASCQYKNYLVIVHSNGHASSHEFASCAATSSVRMSDNALFVSFPATMNRDGFSAWDVWRYENYKLERM